MAKPSFENNITPSFNNFESTKNIQKWNIDISKLSLDHLNSEKKYALKKLCKEYSYIFYEESDSLTFTNKIKHFIQANDEIPVYTKTYRYLQIHKDEDNQ